VLQSNRHGVMTYTLGGFTAGTGHLVTMYFVENAWTAAGKRVFNVSINGTQVLTNFDIFASTGAQFKALQENFNATANSSGQIVISFAAITDNPIVQGISSN
jgi:beta-galactosidase